jgi:alpha-L-glutamate ligase-like protein
LYTSVYNSRKGKTTANSKLLTKETLRKAKIRVPETYAIIGSMDLLDSFDFLKLPTDFVVKPNNGLGGEGIVVIEKRGEYAGEWIDSTGELWRVDDLRLHMADILAGRYSMDDVSDIAYIEERVRVHPVFEKYSYHGTPDIRVIVFNRIPIMSYVRLPTEESGGRANLFQGAAAVGIDIATGITTYGVHHAKAAEFFPGTRRKLANIQIPQWEEILETAIMASEAIGLGYMASDIVLQPSVENHKSQVLNSQIGAQAVPMVLEVNAQPGLKIQIANRAGLRERLNRVKGLKIVSAKHGIRVAQALFVDPKLAEKGLGRKTINVFEKVMIMGLNGEKLEVDAKIDTGADFSSLDVVIAEKLGLLDQENVIGIQTIRNSVGSRKRQTVGISFIVGGKKMKTQVTIADRSKLKYKMLIGKHDLVGFAVVINQHVI